jgi:hypothetical protein
MLYFLLFGYLLYLTLYLYFSNSRKRNKGIKQNIALDNNLFLKKENQTQTQKNREIALKPSYEY